MQSFRAALPRLALAVALVALSSAPLAAQKKPLTLDNYSRWRSIEDATISGNGQWVAYTLRHMNTLPADSKPVLVLRNLQTNRDVEIANAHDGVFSPDSRWIVYQVDSVPAPRKGRGRDTTTADTSGAATVKAMPPRVQLRELSTGSTRSWQRMQSAVFNLTSTHLLLRRRAAGGERGRASAGGPPGRGRGNAAPPSRRTDVVLHDLATGHDLFLGSVGDAAFDRQGDLLAYSSETEPRDGNGLYVLELASNRIHTLDNDTLIYSRIEWSDDGNSVAALKGHPAEKERERDNTLVTFTRLRTTLDRPQTASLDASASGFPKGFVISERASLEWSEDGGRVFFGIIPQTAAPDTGRAASKDSVADVDVWRTQDERIQSVQMIRAERDRDFTFRQAFDVAHDRYVALTDSSMRRVEIAPDGRWAVGFDDRAYIADTAHAKADLYRVNTATGERTLMMKGELVGRDAFGISPDGRYYLYWKDHRYHAYDLNSGTSRTLPGGENGEFADSEWDYVGPRPPYGIAGYASDGSGVIAEQRYDLWFLPFGSGAARNLTNGTGASQEIRFRYVRTEPIDSLAPRRVRTRNEIDFSKPLTLSAYGQWTKKAGYYRLANGRLRDLVYTDAMYGRPVRAAKADRFLLTRQTFAEFPDLQVASGAFSDMRKISDANPQQSEYMWGHRILFDYTIPDGHRLQGILALPDDYQEGQKRPMLVSFYEKNSQNLHRYTPPVFMGSMGSLPVEALSHGYITMLADVYFHTGRSHSDMLEAVEAATRKVIEMGYADPAHIGVNGHSYGGEGAAFIGTRSRLFAAVGMGAGVTDLYTDFSQSWGWTYQVSGGSGENGSDYYMFDQGRWGKSPWDAPDLYHFESALTHVREVTAPFLIMHGTADPTVSFSEGMNFYNALRYNGKEAYLLAYPGEGHHLSGLANRRDLTTRYFEFFDHFLKGAPAPKWMTEGVPYLVKEEREHR